MQSGQLSRQFNHSSDWRRLYMRRAYWRPDDPRRYVSVLGARVLGSPGYPPPSQRSPEESISQPSRSSSARHRATKAAMSSSVSGPELGRRNLVFRAMLSSRLAGMELLSRTAARASLVSSIRGRSVAVLTAAKASLSCESFCLTR